MHQRIVVPLDGSKLAEAALPYAEELAAKMSRDIVLLTVLESEERRELDTHQAYIKKIADVTHHHAEKYVSNGAEVKVAAVTQRGDPAKAIIDYVGKGHDDLAIMASHGRSGVTRWAVGSVADKVVRADAKQPVMLIRAKETRSDIREKRIMKKALVPLDGSIESRSVLPCVSRIAAKLGMELTLLRVFAPNGHTRADVENYLESECALLQMEGVNANYKIEPGQVANRIIDLADELAFDLVAMSTHGRSGMSLWSLGSIAEKVFLGGNTPLLLVKQ